MEISAVDYHTAGEPFRIVTGGVEAAARGDDPRQAARRARPARRRSPAARARAARARRHVRLLRRRARGRRSAPRRRVLPQRRLFDRVRARDDRARHVGARRGHRREAGGREPRRGRRPLGSARHLGARRGRSRAIGALPQRAVVRLGRRCRAPRAHGRRRVRWGLLRLRRGAGRGGRAPAPDRARPRAQARGRSLAGRRPPARAGASGHLRRDLLAGGG